MRSIEKKIANEKAKADMAAAVAAYTGPTTKCPPGLAARVRRPLSRQQMRAGFDPGDSRVNFS
jgi:hypothetical protein